MNLYSLHSNPKELDHWKERFKNADYIKGIVDAFEDQVGEWVDWNGMAGDMLAQTIWEYLDNLDKKDKGIVSAMRKLFPDHMNELESMGEEEDYDGL